MIKQSVQLVSVTLSKSNFMGNTCEGNVIPEFLKGKPGLHASEGGEKNKLNL